jgi:hypothetical protein
MLGGLSSFGPGGWGNSEVARVLPVVMSPRDGQLFDEGVKFVPNFEGLDNYILQVGANRAESVKIWNDLPPLTGINNLGRLKEAGAVVLGHTPPPRPVPVMVGTEAGNGRTLAFGGETWVWARASEEGRLAHRKFWRQAIFWLAHKEDQGENEVKLALDTRRITVGERLGFGLTAKDKKGAPISDLTYDVKVEQEGDGASRFTTKTPAFNQGEQWRGVFADPKAPPGTYRVTAVATREGKEVGRDSARFLVYQDDREQENPAADRVLMRQIADASRGEYLDPEHLAKHIRSQQGKVFTETFSQTERKVWDNWPFLLLFVTLLTLEWWVRKRHGWV